MKKLISVPLACATIALAVAGTAIADGAPTIGAAPFVKFGADEFGDTTRGAQIGNSKVQYWKLSLIAGDRLTIKFKQGAPDRGLSGVYVYPPGTDDYNVSNATYKDAQVTSNGFGQLDYDAATTGTYPLEASIRFPNAGAFDFKATVKHRVRLSTTASRIPARGLLKVTARFPDGKAVPSGLGGTLYGQWGGKWNKLGQAAVKNGVIGVRYALPASLRGKKLKLRLKTGGASFFAGRIDRAVTVS